MTEPDKSFDRSKFIEYFREKIPPTSFDLVMGIPGIKHDPVRMCTLGFFNVYKSVEIEAISYEWMLRDDSPRPKSVTENMRDNRKKALEELSQTSEALRERLEEIPGSKDAYREFEEIFKNAYDLGLSHFSEDTSRTEFMKDLLAVFVVRLSS